MQVSLKNLGTVNKNEVVLSKNGIGTLVLTFSYSTCVGLELSTPEAFKKCVRQNDWSTTTGKLLNELEPDKSKRITGDAFALELEQALTLFN